MEKGGGTEYREAFISQGLGVWWRCRHASVLEICCIGENSKQIIGSSPTRFVLKKKFKADTVQSTGLLNAASMVVLDFQGVSCPSMAFPVVQLCSCHLVQYALIARNYGGVAEVFANSTSVYSRN